MQFATPVAFIEEIYNKNTSLPIYPKKRKRTIYLYVWPVTSRNWNKRFRFRLWVNLECLVGTFGGRKL